MILGGGTPDKNTASTTNDTSSDNVANPAKSVQVHIIYDCQWQGAAGDDGSTNSISSTGEETIDIMMQGLFLLMPKMDGGSGTLTIQILKDGKVIEESRTDTEYGVASVSTKYNISSYCFLLFLKFMQFLWDIFETI